jgi:hypothetical protein
MGVRSRIATEHRRPRRAVCVGAVTVASMLLVAAPRTAAAQGDATREYQIKAAFLLNFGAFVTWLPDAFPNSEAPFVIGVLGGDPFGPILDQVVEGERILGREIVVERYEEVEDVEGCHILFISTSEGDDLDRIFAALAGRGILTVGEVPGFADQSGIIGFVLVDNRLRFQINPTAAEAARLTISSKLLQLADIVRPRG